jgi:hypothetical protein
MKKIIFVFSILFVIAYENVKCDSIGFLGFLTYEYSFEAGKDKNIHNHSVGGDILLSIVSFEKKLWPIMMFSGFGIFAKGINNAPILNMQYLFYLFYSIGPGIGLGSSFSYNFEEKIYGISPTINFTWLLIGIIKPNLFYKYNIYFDKCNTHEIGISINILSLFDG